MKLVRTFFLALLVLNVSGCATTKRSSIAFRKDSGGSLSVWDANMSAAVAYHNGKMCMQRAMAIKNLDAGAELQVSQAMLRLSESYKAAAAGGGAAAGDLATLSATLKQTATLLTTTTERTAYLDMGLFYICQIAANDSITPDKTNELLRTLIISGSIVGEQNSADSLQKLLK